MTARTNPLPYHRDHLALIEDMIALKEAAVARQQEIIRELLLEGGNVVAATNALRADIEALRRLRSDRLVTVNLIEKYVGQGR
jgi:hypothetical protein